MRQLADFRSEHQKLRDVVDAVLVDEDGGATLAEVEAAYSQLLRIDVLNVTPEGGRLWEAAREGYDRRIDRVEEHVTQLLSERLHEAHTAEDMFRVFAKAPVP